VVLVCFFVHFGGMTVILNHDFDNQLDELIMMLKKISRVMSHTMTHETSFDKS